MEEALRAVLLGDAGLAALVLDRIEWVSAPQGTPYPRIEMTRISGTRDYVMQGPSGLVESRVQFDCDGLTYASCKTVARALLNKLSGFSGSQNTFYFQGCFCEGERDGFEDGLAPDKIFRTSLDFMIWHKEI